MTKKRLSQWSLCESEFPSTNGHEIAEYAYFLSFVSEASMRFASVAEMNSHRDFRIEHERRARWALDAAEALWCEFQERRAEKWNADFMGVRNDED